MQPELGREILSLARQVPEPHTFLVVERTIGGIPYQLILHVLWKDDRRKELLQSLGTRWTFAESMRASCMSWLIANSCPSSIRINYLASFGRGTFRRD